ncbi:hypothetical protein BJ165DRAFT_1001213 [Panaeolus papilionaceus]|nr:hypothetical protein BJ165DRAFT_1001213 [Panaeolus papilionaceus]
MNEIQIDDASGPFLPAEIERLIFEMAFDTDDPPTNAMMIMVAKRIRKWIRPLMYRVFDQSNHQNLFPDFEKFKHLKIEEVGKLAKHLLIISPVVEVFRGDTFADKVNGLLRHCCNIENLAYGCSVVVPNFFPALCKLKHLRSLSLNCALIPCSETTEINDKEAISIEGLVLPNLTHLDLLNFKQRNWNFGVIKSIFDTCPSLQIFIIGLNEHVLRGEVLTIAQDVAEEVNDHRLIYFHENILDRKNWLRGTRGERDHWKLAELVVSARENKYFIYEADHWDYIPQDFDWENRLTDQGRLWFSSQHV